MKKYIAAFLVITLCFSLGALVAKVYKPVANAAPQAPTTILGGNYFDGYVGEVVVDGDIAYVAGAFEKVGKESAGSAAVSTTTGALVIGELGIEGDVDVVASDGTGGWYIGGYFTIGEDISFLAHIESDGSLDAAWNPNPNMDEVIYSIVVSGSDIYVAGDFTIIGGENRAGLAKLNNTDGTADPDWDPDPDGIVRDIVVSGSDIYVSGFFSNIGTETRNSIARLNNTDGVADDTWNPNPTGFDEFGMDAIAVSGTYVYAAGEFTAIGGQTRSYLARISLTANPTGLADAVWNPTPDYSVVDIAFSGSDIYVAGYFSSIGGQSRAGLAKLNNTDGNANGTWDPLADSSSSSIEISGSDIYVAGSFTTIGGQPLSYIAKLDNTDGDADPDWDPSPSDSVSDIAVYDTNVYVSGFNSIGGTARQSLAAIDLTTNELTSWNPSPDGSYVTDIAVSGSSIYVSGNFESIGGQTRDGVAKLNNTNGLADAVWDPASSGTVREIAVLGSDIYVGGSFSTIGGQSRSRIAKLNSTDGDADPDWDPSADASVDVITISGSYIYVGGGFDTIGGDARNGLARLLLNGTLDPEWETATMTGLDSYGNPIAGVSIRDIKVSSDGVYISGSFATIGGVSRNGLARLSTDDATLNSTWNPNPDGNVFSIATMGDSVIVGGGFSTIGGQSRSYLAKINNTNGNADAVWNPNAGEVYNEDYAAYNVAIYESSVLVGGYFTSYFNRYDFPTVSFNATSSSGNESTTSVNIPLTLSTASDVDTQVTYAATGGTATGSGTDYDLDSGTVTIPEGDTTVGIEVPITNDSTFEENETIIITIYSFGGSFIGDNAVHTYTITDVGESGGSGGGGGGSGNPTTTPTTPVVPGAAHALGTNVKNSAGTVFTVTTENGATVLRPYTSWGAFVSYGFNSQASIVDANSGDLALSVGSFVSPQDGSIICSDRGSDKGTCYFITQGQKAGFTSAAVFTGQGFAFKNTQNGDVSFLVTITPISSATARHLPGALVNNKSTIQLVGNGGLLGFPSSSVFSSWGYDFAKAVPVNTADTALTQTGVIQAREVGQIRMYY